ncbi:MFS transporter [Paraburkholderia sp. MMS20-SJTN17]|uniref:MFS transporter n=1 Tax=Paraburkholderia translucens TaxID=2886945 RepID=A0ABS8KC39_9BURK|nr:MFS transporter [Paraburkholderia sp. MMS20-SJTN17]MCC8402324.1 MFS transporter [Paraburkholderia sp. MMS20-SJTN17]
MENVGNVLHAVGIRKGARYRAWLLLLLSLIYASSFIDRIFIAVVGQSIKVDMNLTDLQLGVLGGLAFSLFYASLGIPMARLADRMNRITLISVSIVAWSVMTVLCGTAGNFMQLLLYRLGVGIGEAGSTPTAHSLISDEFPEGRRATAMAIYALGPPLGAIGGAIGGGWIAQHFGWRPAFWVVGVPGLILGIIAYLTLREPERGAMDRVAAVNAERNSSLRAIVAILARSPLFLQLLFGTVIGAFAQYGINLFIPAYLTREFGLNAAQAGMIFGLTIGVGGAIGTTFGGWLADKRGATDPRWYAWVPGWGTLLGFVPLALAFLQSDWHVAAALIFLATILLSSWNGPTFAAIHGLVAPRMRATTSAFVFLLMNFIGQGGGPAFIGFLSDHLAARLFAGGDYAKVCHFARGAHGAMGAALDSPLAHACADASSSGLRYAMLSMCVLLVWAAFHYLLAVRHVAKRC